ncbi:hypothetical protein G4G28_09825 [Massilia sp. Dwa41.01b]|uniref:Tad domain-containing protein n=1 Tax=unclassified Massilia TaxID=2609279 RepID=UPI0016034D31|nr:MULTISPECIES: Tad domain-containing protein [unclassified Massilia]QNA88716.1 hypothetical protein G4G28_09825 [Massilia sp. Dwa41.01b]QNA99615.1 hypothetical protein G4G31_13500 [Massilia sp. Se16.2.3]
MTPIHRPFRQLARQRGQALIYGIFILFGALIATFFLFNTGQMSAEKTRLVNTADAVAYSAGVMHARALNFNAYTNRAMLANETTVAQMVSVSSWLRYSNQHMNRINPMLCQYYYAIPLVTATLEYVPLCYALTYKVVAQPVLTAAQNAFNAIGPATVAASELVKKAQQAAQLAAFVALPLSRKEVMEDVANANYKDDGTISVDTLPLTDNWTLFDGGFFIKQRTTAGNERARFRSLELAIVNRDTFVVDRSWTSQSPWPCILLPVGRANHTGSTTLNGYTSWRANDNATFTIRTWKWSLFNSGCKQTFSYTLGTGSQIAATSSSGNYKYSGVPSYFDLSDNALKYGPSNPSAAKKDDPKLQFAIRLTRDKAQQKTSEGRSQIKPSGRLAVYNSNQAGNVMAAVSTSEVFFDRSHAPRADGRRELASLFNPYWQVHLVPNSDAVTAAAIALQGAGP